MATDTIAKGDPFRRNYGTLKEEQKIAIDFVKSQYELVWYYLLEVEEMFGNSRDLAIARHDLQNSCMWAGRAITKTEGQD